MPARNNDQALRRVLRPLAASGVVARAAAALDRATTTTARALRDAILSEIPEYADSGNPEILPGLASHIEDHMREIRRLAESGETGDFAFVRAHAHLRAEQRFPLELILHAYRCGHRTLSHWLRDAAIAALPGKDDATLSAIADFSIEYTNAISTIAASEYVARTRVIAEAEGDQRTELLNILLSGYDESDSRVARILKQAGYLEQRRAYCVIAARSTHPAEMDNPARANRIVEAVSTALAPTTIRALMAVRGDAVVAVLSDVRRQSGWTAPSADLAARILSRMLLLGPSVLVGMSSDQPSTAFVPRALREAAAALDFASAAERVVQFSGLPVRSLLVHRARDYLNATPPGWIGPFGDADAKARGGLVETLRAVADADLNVQSAARKLKVHPNTIYARLERIKALTGFDGRRYHDLTELLLACECQRR